MLEQQKKRDKEEAAQLAQVTASVDAQNAAVEANRIAMMEQLRINNWLEGQAILDAQIEQLENQGASQADIDDLREQAATQGLGVAHNNAGIMSAILQEQKIAEMVNADMTEEERLAAYVSSPEYIARQQALAAWQVEQEEQEKQEAYNQFRQGEWADGAVTVAEKEKPKWWEKAIDWVDQHQVEISIGLGVAVGVVAIIASGGTATPLVMAAWIAGAAVVAGGAVALGTVGLNAYYDRPLGDNVIRNLVLAGGTAVVVTGAGFLFQGVVQGAAGYCSLNPTACAKIEPVLNAFDTVEQNWLIVKGAYQTWVGDSAGAAETTFELQLENTDGGMPGNTVFVELEDLLATKGDEVADLVKTYGNDAIQYLDEIKDVDLANLNLEQGYVVSQLSQEFDIPIAITGRWADTPAETLIREQAYNKMQELISQGVDENLARLQVAQEFGINPHQVKISGGGPEVDVFIPKDAWDALSSEEQEFIRLQLEVFNVENDKRFTIDFY
jgi:hypothetical protein